MRFRFIVKNLFTSLAEFILEMDIGGCEESVDARLRRVLQRFPGPVNVGERRPTEGRDGAAPHLLGYFPDGLEISIGRNRKSCLNNIDL